MQCKYFPLSRVASLFRYRSWSIPPSEVEVLKLVGIYIY